MAIKTCKYVIKKILVIFNSETANENVHFIKMCTSLSSLARTHMLNTLLYAWSSGE